MHSLHNRGHKQVDTLLIYFTYCSHVVSVFFWNTVAAIYKVISTSTFQGEKIFTWRNFWYIRQKPPDFETSPTLMEFIVPMQYKLQRYNF